MKKSLANIVVLIYLISYFNVIEIYSQDNNIKTRTEIDKNLLNSRTKSIDNLLFETFNTNSKKPFVKVQNRNETFWLISTAIVYTPTGNTKKYTYEYDSEFRMSNVKNEIGNNGIWINEGKTEYGYDISGNLIVQQYYTWQNSTWINESRWTMTYDDAGNKLDEVFEEWQNSNWINVRKSKFTYDSNSYLLSRLEEVWKNNSWISEYRTTYTIDPHGNRLSVIEEQWQNNSWVYRTKSSYTYDAKSNKLTELFEQWQNSTWVYFARASNTYDTKSSLLVRVYESWLNGGWNYSARETNNYDLNTNILSTLLEQWQNNSWINYARKSYTYYSNNLTQKLIEQWQNNSWINFGKQDLWYDENWNTVNSESSKWQNGNWIPSESFIDITYNNGNNSNSYYGSSVELVYIPHEVVGIFEEDNNLPLGYQLNQNYPNPFNPTTVIKYSIPVKSTSVDLDVQLKIYDVLGKEVATLINKKQEPGNYGVSLDASSLPSGVYLYRLQVKSAKNGNEEFTKTKRMVLLR